MGDVVEEGELLGVISDPTGEFEYQIEAAEPGLVIGRTNLPLVHRGDAIFHIAQVRHPNDAEQSIERYDIAFQNDPLFDDDEEEII